ncbi:MAG TPA: hypothetical protein DER09_05825 [Prolixibacteraceae bacterium]|nr:hypothetical protein [Prolixibacteraceae bacterium]
MNKSLIFDLMGWLFGILVLAIGIVNIFWGNDMFFGVFIVMLTTVYFPPFNIALNKLTGFSIPVWVKIVLGLFILWAALGVGELFDKVDMMLTDFSLL